MRANALGTYGCLNVDEKRGFLFVCRLMANEMRLVKIQAIVPMMIRFYVDERKGKANDRKMFAVTDITIRRTVN